MTPPARLASAIEILDRYLAGEPLEKALTNWARRSRFAGSKDRAAIRDIVFSCVRCRASFSNGAQKATGRNLALGWVRELGESFEIWFTGDGYGAGALNDEEKARYSSALSADANVASDMPLWLFVKLEAAYEADALAIMSALRQRAPVFARVNLSKITRDKAVEMLALDEIGAEPHALAPTALKIVRNPRKLQQSRAWVDGLVEMQDAASQSLCFDLPSAEKMLDYCAGGGGKSLAYADRHPKKAQIFAHDSAPKRMADLKVRAKRAGQNITVLKTQDIKNHAPFDLILCDVPCSGSGAWRRSPEAKWALTEETLSNLMQDQQSILTEAAKNLTPDGVLAYATCSLLPEENSRQIALFLNNNPGWKCTFERQYTPLDGGDGFYIAYLTNSDS